MKDRATRGLVNLTIAHRSWLDSGSRPYGCYDSLLDHNPNALAYVRPLDPTILAADHLNL